MEKNIAISQTLARGLLVLDAFSEEHVDWGVRELGRKLGINTTTSHRLLATLTLAGYLDRDEGTQRYRLSPKVMRLSGLYLHSNPLTKIASEVFQKYSSQFEYSFYLGGLVGKQVINLVVHNKPGPIRVALEPGELEPIHTTALGKVLAAYIYQNNLRDFVNNLDLFPKTTATITDPEKFIQELENVLRLGYARNIGENHAELYAIGAPIYDLNRKVVSAVSLAYPRGYIDDRQTDLLIDLIMDVSREISIKFGGVDPRALKK